MDASRIANQESHRSKVKSVAVRSISVHSPFSNKRSELQEVSSNLPITVKPKEKIVPCKPVQSNFAVQKKIEAIQGEINTFK